MKNCRVRCMAVFLCLMIFGQGPYVRADDLDVSCPCSLTLTYENESSGLGDLEIKLFQIAKINPEGEFEKNDPYDTYPVDITQVGSQTEWNDIATTLKNYIMADGIKPYRVQKTDTAGKVVFENLTAGLYLVGGVQTESNGSRYIFYDTMMVLPMVDNGIYLYDVNAKLKCNSEALEPSGKTYTILKLWQDSDTNRPQSIDVDIYKDGVLEESIVLSARNQWTYSFTCPDGTSTWSVVERNVPKGYTVKVMEKETSFLIMNTWAEVEPEEMSPVDPPQTGDSLPLISWLYLLCFSGFVLVILGIGMWRREHAQKK